MQNPGRVVNPDTKDINQFYNALITVYGPLSSGVTPLLRADGGTLPTDKEATVNITFGTV